MLHGVVFDATQTVQGSFHTLLDIDENESPFLRLVCVDLKGERASEQEFSDVRNYLCQLESPHRCEVHMKQVMKMTN
jgi:hypothetical protein